jgi:acetyl esterase/lipase
MRTLMVLFVVCGAAALVAAPLAIGAARAAKTEAAGPQAAATDANVKEFVYKKTPQGELKIFVHFPPDWKATDKRPAIVFFFGGGWTGGTPTQFLTQAAYLATRGMVAARADYRVKSRQGTTPVECVEDAKSAVRWLRQKAGELGIDTDRVVAAGGSAGGHIAACTALVEDLDAKDEDKSVSSKPNAMVLFNPVVDLVSLVNEKLGEKDAETAKKISPILYIKKDTPPAIFFYGTTDRFFAQGQAFLAKSKEIGNRAELYSAEGMPHGFFNKSPWTEVTLRKADEFLTSLGYLKGEPTLKLPEGATQTLKKEP